MGQDFPPDRYEIIVVDDGSTDETPEVLGDIRARINCPDLRYVQPAARGLNVARNAGLRAARGDPIAFVDDDVIAPPSWVRAVADGSLRHPEAECFGGPVRLRLEGKPPRLCDRHPLWEAALDLGDVERAVDEVRGGNMSVRRTAIERVGPFNEVLSGLGDEGEWELRLLKAGGRIVYLPEGWVWHRRSARDLRLWQLLRAQFRRGVEVVAFERVIEQPLTISQDLMAILRYVAHAVRRRCAGGLLSASFSAGRAAALVRERVMQVRSLKYKGVKLLRRSRTEDR